MRAVRTVIMALGLAGLAACGGSKEPAASEDIAQSGASPSAEDTAAPPVVFAQCISCHSVKPGVNGVGPSLYGAVGRKAGTLPGYAYSDALKAWGKTLTPEELDRWLTAPMKDVPGTKMVFPGIPDAAKRKAVIDYLVTLK
jgi:cytochrome c